MPETPQFNPEEYAQEKGDFTDVHNPEFQNELRSKDEDSVEAKDKEFELTPEIEAKIMEKVVAIGRQRDLLSHGTSAPFLDMTAEYGLMAFVPKFRHRWKGFSDFHERRKQVRPGRSPVRTSAGNQGWQSVSFFDPWNEIEVLEKIQNKEDYICYAIPLSDRGDLLNQTPEGQGGREIKPSTELLDELEKEILKRLPCKIEEINSIYVPPKTKTSGLKAIIKGKFRVDNDTLNYLKTNLDESEGKVLNDECCEIINNYSQQELELVNQDLQRITEHYYNFKKSFYTLEVIIKWSHGYFIRQFHEIMADAEINDATRDIFNRLRDQFGKHLSNDQSFEERLGSKTTEHAVIEGITSGAWRGYGSLLVQLTENDIISGRVVRNQSSLISDPPTGGETYVESRISPRKIIGIVPGMSDAEFSERQNIIAETINWPQPMNRGSEEEKLNEYISTEKATNFAQRLEIPVYDKEGGMLWPRHMSYEEVKQFVAERDSRQELKSE